MIRISMTQTGDLRGIAEQMRRDMAQDVTLAVQAATRGAVLDLRQDIGRAFPKSRRMATMIAGATEPSRPGEHSLNAAGRIYGRGGKRSAWPAPLWAQLFGAEISAKNGGALAIPTKAVPRDQRNRALTPAEVEARFRVKLAFIPAGKFGKLAALVMPGDIQRTRRRGQKAPRAVVMFWLVRNVTLRARLDPRDTIRRWADQLPDLVQKAKAAREAAQGRRQ